MRYRAVNDSNRLSAHRAQRVGTKHSGGETNGVIDARTVPLYDPASPPFDFAQGQKRYNDDATLTA
jgi:hypothetical protein